MFGAVAALKRGEIIPGGKKKYNIYVYIIGLSRGSYSEEGKKTKNIEGKKYI